MRDKAIKKAVELKNDKRVTDAWDKATEKALESKTNKRLLVEGALGTVVVVAFGGAVVPTVLGAVAEGVISKKITKRAAAKKAAQNKNKPKPGSAGPKPE